MILKCIKIIWTTLWLIVISKSSIDEIYLWERECFIIIIVVVVVWGASEWHIVLISLNWVKQRIENWFPKSSYLLTVLTVPIPVLSSRTAEFSKGIFVKRAHSSKTMWIQWLHNMLVKNVTNSNKIHNCPKIWLSFHQSVCHPYELATLQCHRCTKSPFKYT